MRKPCPPASPPRQPAARLRVHPVAAQRLEGYLALQPLVVARTLLTGRAPFAARPRLEGGPGVSQGWDKARPRPLRLLRRPEPIEATAPIPDDPPLFFRWRGQLHRVRRSEGPERLAEEWWRRPPGETTPAQVRDYYRVEDEAGGRFWIFRAGLYSAQAPAPASIAHGSPVASATRSRNW